MYGYKYSSASKYKYSRNSENKNEETIVLCQKHTPIHEIKKVKVACINLEFLTCDLALRRQRSRKESSTASGQGKLIINSQLPD